MSHPSVCISRLVALFATALVACGGGGGGGGDAASAPASTSPTPTPASSQPPTPAPVPAPVPTAAKLNLFFSGHSLTEAPLGEYTAAVAASLGKQTLWNQQIALGSPIRFRTRGFSDTDPSWAGYSQGINRDGASMNFLAELRNPQTLNGQRYDALIVTDPPRTNVHHFRAILILESPTHDA